MDVWWVGSEGLEGHRPEDIKALLERDGGFVWVDIASCDDEAARVLSEVFAFHPLAVRDCRERTMVPKLRTYPEHLFAILHAPEPGEPGHVHLVELDQFVSHRYLVTAHGPLGEGVPLEAALRETGAVRERMEAGRFRPGSPGELSHAIVSALATRFEQFVSDLAGKVAALERHVMKGDQKDPERALEELFRVRHEILTVRTMAAQSHEVYARIASLSRFLPEEGRPLTEDLVDRFARIRGVCDEEKEFLQGVVDLYQSRTATKMNIAMERLALIAAVMLPITAVASVYGMNIVVNEQTDVRHLLGVLGSMGLVSGAMLWWAKRHGWW